MTKGNLILQGLPPLDTVLRVSEQPPFTIDFGQLKPVEQSTLRAAGRGDTIQSITERLEQDRGRTLRACYGLLCAGLLERAPRIGHGGLSKCKKRPVSSAVRSRKKFA